MGHELIVPHEPTLREKVAEIGNIRLIGFPTTVVYDKTALGDNPQTQLQLDGLSKLGLVVRPLTSDEDLAELDPNLTVGIFGQEHAVPEGMYSWQVGEGPNALDINRVLALLGTAVVQERAGIAFRAAGSHEPIPSEYDYNKVEGEEPVVPRILRGITRAASTPKTDEVVQGNLDNFEEMARDPLRFISTRVYPAIARAVSPTGAIAAAREPEWETDPNDPTKKVAKGPNYWFFWQRDGGQTAAAMSHLAKADPTLAAQIEEELGRYAGFVEHLPENVRDKRDTLGISRYEIGDETHQPGDPIVDYGNPQNDGPAHTALAIMAALPDNPQEALRIARPYLEYLAHGIEDSFDPWEFVVAERNFYIANLARRALRQAINLDPTLQEAYGDRVRQLEEQLAGFYDEGKGYLVANRDPYVEWMDTTSQLDISTIGSIISHEYDVEDDFMNVEDDRVRSTMRALEEAFARRWAVNLAWSQTHKDGSMGMGRFPEDTNDGIGSTGGNPWTFATLWASQYYYRLAERKAYLESRGRTGEVRESREELLAKADGYLRFVLERFRPNASGELALSEQIDGQTGSPRGMEELAWAHAELTRAILLRRSSYQH